MKTITDFANDNGLVVVPIRFTFQGFRLKRKGFDICRTDGGIVLTIEPVNSRYDDSKWYITSQLIEYDSLAGSRAKRAYVKRITRKVLTQFPLNGNAYCKNIEVNQC
jgi:hypothetical protein